MSGRHPKSTKLKMITGNPGGRPLNENEPQPEIGIPEIPDWIKEFPRAVENWEHESEILDGMRLMTHAEAGLLAMRSYLFSQLVELALLIKQEGRVVDGKTNPNARQLDSLIKEYRICGNLLGLDASSRSKLAVGSKHSGNEWDDI